MEVARQQAKTELKKSLKTDVLGLRERNFPGYELPFTLRGQHQLDHFSDSEHESQNADGEYDDMQVRDDLDSQVLETIEKNYQLYKDELNDRATEQEGLQKQGSVKFDEDPEFARQTIRTTISSGKFRMTDDVKPQLEPERDFEKLRARIKLKAIKKFTEDDQKKKAREYQYETKLAEGKREIQNKPKRKIHGPIERRRSFTEMQLKFEENLAIYEEMNPDTSERSFRDRDTISRMQKAMRYPIPEQLMNQPSKFWLKIDSFTHELYSFQNLTAHCDDKIELVAPRNSSESEEVVNLDSSDEEVKQKEQVEGPTSKYVFQESLVDMQPFHLQRMGVFPHKHRENEPPLKLILKANPLSQIKETMEAFQLVQEGPPLTEEEIALQKLKEEEEEENNKLGLKKEKVEKPRGTKYTNAQCDEIYEHYCDFYKTPRTKISKWLVPADNNRRKLSIKNYALNEQQIKAICATMPFIPDLFELELVRCQITDMMSTLFLFAAYFCPSLKRFCLVSNPISTNFKTSLLLIQEQIDGDKFLEFNFAYSVQKVELMDTFAKAIRLPLVKLNLEGIPLGMQATRKMSSWLLQTASIKDLNLMKCGLAD